MNRAVFALQPALGAVLFLTALALPSPLIGRWDGLPWDRPQEMLLVSFALPLWAVAFPSSLGGRMALLSAALLAASKLVGLAIFPSEGLTIRVYQDEDALAENRWETVSPWFDQKLGSARLDRNLGNTREFPLEWMNRYSGVPAVSAGNLEAMKEKISSSWRQRVLQEQGDRAALGEAVRRAARPWVDLRGWVWLRKGEALVLETGSLRGETLTLGGKVASATVPDGGDGGQRIFPATGSDGWLRLEGRWEIMDLFPSPDRNYLELLILGEDGKKKPMFSPGRTSPRDDQPASQRAGFIFARAYAVLLSVLGFFLLAAPVVSQATQPGGGKALAWVIGLGSLAWVGPYLCSFFGFGSLSVRMTWGLLPVALALWASAGKASRLPPGISLFRIILAITAVGLATALFPDWKAGMQQFTWFSPGDDWTTLQNHGRSIAQGDWLNAGGEAVWAGQFGYRYVAAILHHLFGQSWWAGQVLDLWSLALMAAIPALLAGWLGLSRRAGLLVAALVLGFIGASSAKDYLGSGLQEWVASACLLAAAAATASLAEQAVLRFVLWLLFVPWAFWLRLDHLPILVALGLLLGRPTAGSWGQVVGGLGTKARIFWQPLAIFLLIVGMSVALVFFRNFVCGGVWALTDSGYVGSKLSTLGEEPLRMVKMVLLGWQGSTGGPGPLALVLFPAAILVLVSLVGRIGKIRNWPIEAALILLAGLLPYALVQEFSYAPRFCIHLVPWACLVLVAAWGFRGARDTVPSEKGLFLNQEHPAAAAA